jgi:hypothetical protein
MRSRNGDISSIWRKRYLHISSDEKQCTQWGLEVFFRYGEFWVSVSEVFGDFSNVPEFEKSENEMNTDTKMNHGRSGRLLLLFAKK